MTSPQNTSFDEVRNVDIKEYLSNIGFQFRQRGRLFFCKSPFSNDKTWSFAYYPHTNSFYDWSCGFGGSIIDLVMSLEGTDARGAVEHLLSPTYTQYITNYKKFKLQDQNTFYDFEYTRYLNVTEKERNDINEYAKSRGWFAGYECGVYFTPLDDGWQRHPAVMFLHRDENMKLCGAKFRKLPNDLSVDKDNSVRFTSRGKQGIFLLENVDSDFFGDPVLFVVEGEGNAISLWQFLSELKRNCIVISFGGVSNIYNALPKKLMDIKDRKLVIDYDGNEELFNNRVKNYEQLNLQPIKLILNKGEDINTLYLNNKLKLIEHLL